MVGFGAHLVEPLCGHLTIHVGDLIISVFLCKVGPPRSTHLDHEDLDEHSCQEAQHHEDWVNVLEVVLIEFREEEYVDDKSGANKQCQCGEEALILAALFVTKRNKVSSLPPIDQPSREQQ